MQRVGFLFVLFAVAATSGPAAAKAPTSPFIPIGASADAPSGFVEMCDRDAELCSGAGVRAVPGVRAPCLTSKPTIFDLSSDRSGRTDLCDQQSTVGAQGTLAMRKQELKLLRRINAEVNRHVVQAPDMTTSGVDERWQRPDGAGDCEDLAIEKRVRLIQAGFDPSRMFFAVAFLRGFGLHTVLVARLADGDRVLDSLSPHLLKWSAVHYSWLRLQSAENPMVWSRVDRS